MNNYERIEYSMQLEEQKEGLERNLEKVNEQIEQNKCDCAHIIVVLGCKDTFPNYGKEYRCLLCGNHFQFLNDPELFVDARRYMKDVIDDLNPLERAKKFEIIQTITLGIAKENLEISNDEIVDALNNMIKEHIKQHSEQNVSCSGSKDEGVKPPYVKK